MTHRGLSGPAVLQASSYWRPGEALVLDFAPDLPLKAELLDGFVGAGSAAGFGGAEAGFAGGACRSGWRIIWRRPAGRRAGRMRRWRSASGGCTVGSCIRWGRRALRRPR